MKKNGAVISVICLLLFVAVYLNWQYSRGDAVEEIVNGDLDGMFSETAAADDSLRLEEMSYAMENDPAEASAESELLTDGSIVTGVRAEELNTYFDETRLDRQQTRDAAINMLQTTLENESASSEAKTDAEESIAVLASNAVAESRIESLVMAKGFVECVAMIDDTGVSVVVLPEEAGLEASDVSKIKDIIMSQTSVSADLIRIIEAK